MSSTVTDARRRVSGAKVKNESGSFKRAARWMLGIQPREDAETATPAVPDEQSRWAVEQVRGELHKAVAFLAAQKRVVGSPTDLDGSRPAYLLRHIGMLALDGEIDPELTFQGAVERLQSAWNMLLERAAEQAALERHTPVNAVEAAADGALLGGMPSAARARVVVTDIVGRSLNAPKPTALQVKMTPDVLGRLDAGEPVESVESSVTATAVMSPVHLADGVAAPLPDDEAETADPGADAPHATALPKRTPHPVHIMPAPMSDGENPQPIGLHPRKPAYGEVHGGDWVFDDSADAAVLKLVKQVTVARSGSGDPVSARVFFEDGSDRRVKGDRTVRVLGAADAVALLERYGAQVAQLEAAS